MNRRRVTYFSSLAAAGAIALAACGTPADTPQSQPVETVTVTPTPEPTVTDWAPPTDYQLPDTDPGLMAEATPLGSPATTDKGLQMTVTEGGTGVTEYTGIAYTDYTFELVNNTGQNFDPVSVTMNINYGAAGTPASQQFDLMRNPTPYFRGVILPGGTQTITASYDVPAGEPVVISVVPSWDDSPMVFVG